MIALFSCSTIYTETIDEKYSLDSQTKGETSQNDSTQGGGVSATINPWEEVSDGDIGEATEDAYPVNENDSTINKQIF